MIPHYPTPAPRRCLNRATPHRRTRAHRPRNDRPRPRRQRRPDHRRPDAAGAGQHVARHGRKIPRHRQRRLRHRRPDHRDFRTAAARPGSQLPHHRAHRPGRRDQGERGRLRLFPARHHRISDDRRAGDADGRPRAAADLQRHHVRPSNIGALQQDQTIPAQVDIEQLVSKHFAVIGTTGVGKSNGVAILL